MVYYRKYRPQSLTELIGQENIKNALQSAIKSQKLAHAYLFCGPKGTGKTSTARILAKAVNCTSDNLELVPCNSCISCNSITDGSNLDLIEIDAASNRGIDDIRALREKIKLSPTQAKKKVYIIDEVHMLTTEAFNALLKTLEEPPQHVLFILATTDPQKIPATILSRVQRLDFQLATPDGLIQVLKGIASKEKLQVDDDALFIIAKKSEGSFRDAEKMLDQLATLGEKITVNLVEDSFRSGKFETVKSLLESVSEKNGKAALELVSNEVVAGTNVKDFILMVLDYLQKIIYLKHGVKKDGDDSKELNNLSDKLTLDQVLSLISSLNEALERMKTTTMISLPLEVAVLENCIDKREIEVVKANILQQVNEDKVSSEIEISSKLNKKDETSKVDDVNRSSSVDLEKILDKWQFILETIKPYNYSLEAMLKQVRLLSFDEGILTIEVPYSFHQRILETPKSRDLLESVITDVVGKPARISTVIGKRPVKIEEVANVEVAADDDIIRVAAEIFNS